MLSSLIKNLPYMMNLFFLLFNDFVSLLMILFHCLTIVFVLDPFFSYSFSFLSFFYLNGGADPVSFSWIFFDH